MAECNCRSCHAPLPWVGSLRLDGVLCLRCLRVWLARQRERERVSA